MPKNKLLIFFSLIFISHWFFYSCDKSELIEEEEIIPFGEVTGFVINEQGDKLLATDIGLYVLNENSGTFEPVESETQLFPLNDLAFSNASSERELWLASNSGVLNFTSQTLITESAEGLQNNIVNHVNFDNSNRAYFVTPAGISILENSAWTNTTGLNEIYLNYKITDIGSATNGFTYVTTNGGGVERFKMDVDGISGATVFDTDWSKLESNNVNTVFIDSITQVYGTEAGVAMHFSEYTKWDWQVYTTADGLVNDTVIAIVKDKSKNWWFGTPQGLSRFDNSTWQNYTLETDKLISNKIKFLAIDTDGSVWFACDEGLSHFTNNQWINYSKNK